MTLDEAIKHTEEVAEKNERLCKAIPEHSANAFHCAEEHRQLAEWLKELKQTRQAIEDIKAEIRKKHLSIIENNDFDNGRTYGYDECLAIIDKHISGKEN